MGLKLVNYILEDNSPAVKELETRLKGVKIKGSGGNGGGNGAAAANAVSTAVVAGGNGAPVEQVLDNTDAASTDSTSSKPEAKHGSGSRAKHQHASAASSHHHQSVHHLPPDHSQAVMVSSHNVRDSFFLFIFIYNTLNSTKNYSLYIA